MLGDISLATNIYIVTGYTDMRKSIDGLCAIVMDQLKEEPNTSCFAGSVVIGSKCFFANRMGLFCFIKNWMLSKADTAGLVINPR